MLVDQKIDLPKKADIKIKVSDAFGIDSDLTVSGYKEKTQLVHSESQLLFDYDLYI